MIVRLILQVQLCLRDSFNNYLSLSLNISPLFRSATCIKLHLTLIDNEIDKFIKIVENYCRKLPRKRILLLVVVVTKQS